MSARRSRQLQILRFTFPYWIPTAAKSRIIELYVSPLGDDNTASGLLERLATYEVMRTEVWKKLPPEPKVEGDIIAWAFHAYTVFLALPRPYPRGKKLPAWIEHRKKHPPLPDFAFISQLVVLLAEKISETKLMTEADWPRLWEGEAVSADQVLAILDQLRRFYVRMHEEQRAIFDWLPKIKRWNAKSAQKFFTEFLSQRMSETYGQPCDSIVAALAEVAFDLPVDPETVRGRRRLGNTPEKSNRKTR